MRNRAHRGQPLLELLLLGCDPEEQKSQAPAEPARRGAHRGSLLQDLLLLSCDSGEQHLQAAQIQGASVREVAAQVGQDGLVQLEHLVQGPLRNVEGGQCCKWAMSQRPCKSWTQPAMLIPMHRSKPDGHVLRKHLVQGPLRNVEGGQRCTQAWDQTV